MGFTTTPQRFRVAVTGGIGSGKSYVCRLLEQHGISIYDCDAQAKRLMRTSATLQHQLSDTIGANIAPCGHIDKALLSRYLLASEDNKARVNAIVHPAVIADFLASPYTWMESAILFESGYAHVVQCIVCVCCPDAVRIERICQRDGITPTQARQWIDAQWPQERVRQMAHLVVDNDGTTPLTPQIDNLLQRIGDMQTDYNNSHTI